MKGGVGMRPQKQSLTPSERAVVSGRIATRLSQEPEVSAAYIFGSFTRSEAFGDIDVGVFVEAPESLRSPLEYEFSIESALEKAVRLPVDVRVLNGAPLSFQHQVISKGVLIIDRDPNRRAAFEGNVRKQYFDFSRFRNRYLKEAAHAGI